MKVSAASQPLNPAGHNGISSYQAVTFYKIAYRRHTLPNHSIDSMSNEASSLTHPLLPQTEDKDDFYGDFYESYVAASTQEAREAAVQTLVAKLASSPLLKFEPNYEDGIFFIRAAENGDLPFLQWLVECSEHTVDLSDAFMVAAHDGHLDCVKFLVDKGLDPNSLLGSTAYNNHAHIKNFLDAKREELKKDSPRKMVKEISTLIEHIEQEPTPIPNALQTGLNDIVKKYLADGPIEAISTCIIKILQEYYDDKSPTGKNQGDMTENKTKGKEQRDALLLGCTAAITLLMDLDHLEKKIPTPPDPNSFA